MGHVLRKGGPLRIWFGRITSILVLLGGAFVFIWYIVVSTIVNYHKNKADHEEREVAAIQKKWDLEKQKDMEWHVDLDRKMKEGYKAAKIGVPDTACPYMKEAWREYWLKGWIKAKEEQ